MKTFWKHAEPTTIWNSKHFTLKMLHFSGKCWNVAALKQSKWHWLFFEFYWFLGAFTYGDRMGQEADDLEDAFPNNDGDPTEGYVDLVSNLPFECNAFYFNNHHLRLFDTVDPNLDSNDIQSDGWTAAVLDIYDNERYNHGKDNDEWIITVGFTHPRPHNNPAVILCKNNSLEIRLKSDYDYVNDDDDGDKTGHYYKQEMLEVFLIYATRGHKKDKVEFVYGK